MAKRINSSDLFESDDLFKGVRNSANQTLKLLEKLNSEFRKTASSLKGSIKNADFNNAAAINEFIKATAKANQLRQQTEKLNALQAKTQQEVNKALQQGAKAQSEKNKADQQAQKIEQEKQKANQQTLKTEQEKQRVNQQSIKTEQEKQRLERETLKTERERAREAERQAKEQEKINKANRDANSVYKQLERNTRELKNQSKELGAQLMKLEADGKRNSSEYRRLAQTYREVTAAAQRGDAQLKKLDKTVGDNFRNVGNYRDALGSLQGILGSFGVAFGVGSALQNMTGAVMEFEQQNATLSAVLGTTRDKTVELQKQQRELGKSSGYSAAQVAELQLELARVGQTEEQIKKSTNAVLMLAKASGSDLAKASEVSASVVNAFGLQAYETQRVVDVMAKSFDVSALGMDNFAESIKYVATDAKTAGVSLEETTAMLALLSNVGIKGSQAGTALRRIFSEMAMTGKPVNEALEELGAKGIGIADAYDEVGRSAQTALLSITGNLPKLQELTNAMNNANGAASKTATTMTDTLGGSLGRLRGAWEGYILDLNESTGAGEKLRSAIDFLSENLTTILDTIVHLIELWAKWKVITLAQIGYNKLMASSFMQTATQMRGMGAVVTGLKGAFQSLGQVIKNNLAGIALMAIFELYQMFSKLNEAMNKSKKMHEEIANEQKKVADNTAREKREIDALFVALKKTNNGSIERKNLIDEINARYGTTLQNLANEKDFVKQVDDQYKNLMNTLKSRSQLEGKRVAFEVSQRSLAEVEMELRSLENKLKGFGNEIGMIWGVDQAKKSGAAPSVSKGYVGETGVSKLVGGLIKNIFGVDDVNQIIDQYNALGKSYQQLLKDATKYENDYNAAQAQNIMSGPKSTPTQTPVPTPTGPTGPSGTPKIKDVREYSFELDAVNEYLSRQIELLQELNVVYQDTDFTKKADEIDGAIRTVVARAKNRAIEGLDPLDFVIPGEMYDATERQIIELFEFAKANAKQRTDFEISEIDRKNKYEKDQALKTLNENYQNQKEQYQKELKDLQKADPSDVNIVASKANLNKALADLDKDYQNQLKQLDVENAKRDTDAETEKKIVKEKFVGVELQIEKDKNDKINEYNDQLNTSIEEGLQARGEALENAADNQIKTETERLNKIKERWDTMTEFVKATTDFFIEQSERRIEQYEREREAATNVYDDLRQLAINGNIDAQKSLAEQQRAIDEYNKKIQREEKRQQRIKLAATAFESYNKNVQNLEPGQKSSKALADTIRDITLLTQFVNTLPAFYEGTEDTGTNGRGVDGRGGFKAILHPNERVIPKKYNDKIGSDISNEQLTKIATEYKAGKLVRDGEQLTSALNFSLLVNKLDEVNKTIKEKPENYYGLGEVTQSMFEIIDKQKKGNTIIYNRYRVKR